MRTINITIFFFLILFSTKIYCQKIYLSTKIDSLIIGKTTIKQTKKIIGKPNSVRKYRNSGTNKREENLKYDSLFASLTFYDDTLQCIFIVKPKSIWINSKLFLKADTSDILKELGTKNGEYSATYGATKVIEYTYSNNGLSIYFGLDGLFVGFRSATRKYDELPFIVR
jgi:hypothetical protein